MHAQGNVTGSIYGTVSGAVAGSTITVVNPENGTKRSTTVDATGTYQLTGLSTGTYAVTLHAPGQTDQTEKVAVSVGVGSPVSFTAGAKEVVQLEAMTVTGDSIAPIDMSRSDSVIVLNSTQIQQLPVERDTASVALLAPGTSQGVAAFGKLVSFGGSSVAENAYYVNGFNLTNFRTGLGGGSVPFEFYDQFNIETGGYSAEFGRSTGGVINATTKRGSNNFVAGANIFYEPNALSTNSPSVNKNGVEYIDHSRDFNQSTNANVYVGGAIIKDKLFYYGIYNVRDTIERDAQAVSTYYTQSSNNPFYGLKLDWNIADGHSLAFTAIKDQRRSNTNTLDYSEASQTVGKSHGLTYSDRGGKDYILNYSGQITQDFTVTAMAGQGTGLATDYNSTVYVVDSRVPPSQIISGSSTFLSALKDTRKSYRLDASYHFTALGSHTLRVGYDREDTSSATKTTYPGDGIYYRYFATAPGKIVNTAVVPAGVTQYAREQIYGNNGNFKTISKAYFAEDNWKTFDDRLLLSLGLRNDDFNNLNKLGQSFVHLTNQWAPRLGATFDLNKDGKTKLFANYGRYTMPVANNTNIRFAGGETYTQDYYVLNSVDPVSFKPVLGAQLGPHVILPGEDGSVHDPKTIVNQDLKPMYQDEYIVGIQRDLGNGWTAGLRGIYRNMGTFIEDVDVDLVPGDDSTLVDVLTNPGHTMVIYGDLGDGKGLQKFTLNPNQQTYNGEVYPKAQRTYYAAEFSFEKVTNGKWWLQGSYTWSHTYGNDEGYVLSDIGQPDAGITELFDWPQIMNGRYGNLNNDRRHKFKLFGAYNVTPEIQVGANYLLQSGTPKIGIGYWPGSDGNLASYGAAFFYINGVLVPRGSLGTTPWMQQLDLSAKYTPEWAKKKLTVSLDLFNVLVSNTPTEYYQYAELGGTGIANPEYGTPSAYQHPFYTRLSMSYKY